MLGRTMLAGTVMALAAACGDDAVPGTAPGDELTRDQMDAVARQLQVQCEQEHPGPDATALCTCIVMSVAHGQDRADATDYCGRPQMLKMMRSLGRATDAVGGGGGHHQGAAEPEGPSRTIVAEALGVPMPPGTHQLVAEGSGGSDGVETRAVWLVATAPCDTVVETLRERFGADLDVSNRARIPVTESVVVGVHEPGDARWEPPAGEPPAGVRCGVVVRQGG